MKICSTKNSIAGMNSSGVLQDYHSCWHGLLQPHREEFVESSWAEISVEFCRVWCKNNVSCSGSFVHSEMETSSSCEWFGWLPQGAGLGCHVLVSFSSNAHRLFKKKRIFSLQHSACMWRTCLQQDTIMRGEVRSEEDYHTPQLTVQIFF